MTDPEIVELYLARDESAILHTANRYGARLRSLANGILEDTAAAEECENDTYLAAWNSIPPHEPHGYLFAYLARIARHNAIDRCRARSREKRGARLEELTAELMDCIPSQDHTEAYADAKELASAISSFLYTLPEGKRDLFLRRYWYCDSISALAKRTGWKESRVKTALYRIRNELRNHLKKEGYIDES